jgi:phage virion morphogenesis protein
MAGSFLKVNTVGTKPVSKALNQLLKNVSDISQAQRDIGEYLIETTQQRFVDQQAPDGSPWDPVSPKTLAKKRRSDRVLTESGTLADTLSYQLKGNTLLFGSNLEYAATHQFGREEDGITAREFLGIAPFEAIEILDILQTHLVG